MELGFEVVVTTPDQRIIPNGRLTQDARDTSLLELRIPSQFTIDPATTIDCLFTTMEKPFFFQSKITEQAGRDEGYRRYRIVVPETIEECNRRSYCRVNPAIDEPVWLHFHHDRKGPVRVLIDDICLGGVSIVMPEKLRIDNFKSPLSCEIHLPDDEILDLKISACNRRTFFGAVMIGAEIVSITKDNRLRIEAYVNQLMKKKTGKDAENSRRDVRLAVIEHPDSKTLSPLLKDHYIINRAWQAHNLAKLRAYLPDIVVVEMDHPEAITCLKNIKNSPALRARPLVIVGEMHRAIMAFGSGIRYLSKPVHQRYLQRAIDNLISTYRVSRRIVGLPTRCWQTTTTVIIHSSAGKNNDATAQHLRHNNIQTIVIEDQKRFVPQLLQKVPQCIILDADDAASVGTICRVLSRNRLLKHTPVILLTEHRELGEQFTKKNMVTGFIEKSYSPDILVSAVYCAITMKRAALDS